MKAQKYGAALGSHGVSGGRFGELKNPASKGARRTEKAQEASDISHDSSNEEMMVKRRGIHPLISGLVRDRALTGILAPKMVTKIPRNFNLPLFNPRPTLRFEDLH